jgi:hypothetical protein
MITDPKTTVRSRNGQMIVAFLVAAVEMLFRLNSCIYAPLYALFIVGPAALLIETWWTSQKTHKTDPAATALGFGGVAQ